MARKRNKYKKSKFWPLMIIFVLIVGLLYIFIEANIVLGQVEHEATTILTTAETTTSETSIINTELEESLTKINLYISTHWSGGFEIGSGVIISSDDTYYYAITNEHVIDGDDNLIGGYQVMTYDEVQSSFEVLASDEEKDLALIRFEKSDHDSSIEPLHLSTTIEQNNLVVSIGNPYGNIGTITYGFIEQMTILNELEIEHEAIEHTCTLYRGSSGGALVSQDGYLIGINTWELNGNYYAIPIHVVQEFITNNL